MNERADMSEQPAVTTMKMAQPMPNGPYGAVLHDGDWHITVDSGEGTLRTVAEVESPYPVTIGSHMRGDQARELVDLLNLGRAAAHAGWRP